MKKNLLSFAVLVALVLSACAQQKKNATSATTTTQSKTSSQKIASLNYVGMERTACFGTCPAYLVELHADGRVRYTSRMFTEYEGVYEKNVDPAQIKSIITEFQKYRVDTCRENYEAYIQDLPGIIYTFKFGTEEKKIFNANFGPEYLKTMANKIDQIGGKPDKTWKKVGEVPKN